MRFNRNISTISLQQQELLSTKKVLVVGLGGLGSHVIEGLTRLGITKLGICDYDVSETSNLNRQLLVTEQTIGISKVKLALERIKAINSEVEVTTYHQAYPNAKILEDLKQYDLVIDCLDSIAIRQVLEKDCVNAKKKVVYGTIAGNFGYFGVISQNNQLMSMQESNTESIEKVLGNVYYTVSIVASMQILLAIKVLLSKEYLEDGFYTIDLNDISIDHVILN